MNEKVGFFYKNKLFEFLLTLANAFLFIYIYLLTAGYILFVIEGIIENNYAIVGIMCLHMLLVLVLMVMSNSLIKHFYVFKAAIYFYDEYLEIRFKFSRAVVYGKDIKSLFYFESSDMLKNHADRSWIYAEGAGATDLA